MFTRLHWLAATSLALAAVPLAAQDAASPAPQFDVARIATHIQTLGSDAFEGRGPATRGETMTVDYLVREFQAAGLEPGGEVRDGRRQWTQDVPLLKSDLADPPHL